MITKSQIIPLFLKACPSFYPIWKKEHHEWDKITSDSASEEYRAYYPHITRFANHIVNLLNNDQIDEFPKIFKVVEKILQDGDQESKELMVVGLIEDLQSLLSHPPSEHSFIRNPEVKMLIHASNRGSIDDRRLYRWLGPKTKKAWVDIRKAFDEI